MTRIIVLLLFTGVAACSGNSAPLAADALDIRLPRPGTEMGVAYMTIANTTSAAITITSVTSPQFESVEMHETVIADGVSRMRRLEAVTIPAASSVTFQRGGKHLMLVRPQGTPDAVVLTFHTRAAPVLTVSVSDPY